MDKPIKILHILGGMNRGGVETWLMHVLRHIDRTRYQMDFLVHTTEPCAYDDEIRTLGSQIIPCLHPSHPLKYAQNLSNILKEYGPYDVVHSHVHHFSGWVLRTAAQAGVPIRIAHSHSDTSTIQKQASLLRKLYFGFMNFLIQQTATHKIGVSQKAAAALFGKQWVSKPDHRIIYYGIDFTPFLQEVDKALILKEIGVPEDAFVIGHVGRFVHPKNHHFLIEIAAEVCHHEPDVYFLLVGDGPLRPAIEEQVARAGLSERVIFAGLREDVPRIMLAAMDCFLFPSFYEGLPVTLIEVLAAGLPAVISDSITEESDLIKPLLHRLSLNQSVDEWVEAVIACKKGTKSLTQSEALNFVQKSHFNVKRSVRDLVSVYEG